MYYWSLIHHVEKYILTYIPHDLHTAQALRQSSNHTIIKQSQHDELFSDSCFHEKPCFVPHLKKWIVYFSTKNHVKENQTEATNTKQKQTKNEPDASEALFFAFCAVSEIRSPTCLTASPAVWAWLKFAPCSALCLASSLFSSERWVALVAVSEILSPACEKASFTAWAAPAALSPRVSDPMFFYKKCDWSEETLHKCIELILVVYVRKGRFYVYDTLNTYVFMYC